MMDTFLHLFLTGYLAASVLILFILSMKKGLKRHISAEWQYRMDFLFFVLLAVPFLPAGLFSLMNMGNGWFDRLFSVSSPNTAAGAVSGEMMPVMNGDNWLQDFTLSVQHASSGLIAPVFLTIWLTGIAVFAVFTCRCSRELRLVTESMKPVEGGELAALFARCKAELGIRRNILLGTSILAKSPMAAGLFRSRVILPAGIGQAMEWKEIRYILLHELTHLKNGDIPLGYLMCLFQALHWFNPLADLAFIQIRQDRANHCVATVLKSLPSEERAAHVKTLIHFAARRPKAAALFLATVPGAPV